MTFPGFPDDSTEQVRIPEPFFRQILPTIADMDELMLTVYIFWRIDRSEGDFHYILLSDLLKDSILVHSMASDRRTAKIALQNALQKAVSRATFLQADFIHKAKPDKVICLNSPKNHSFIDAIRHDGWKIPDRKDQVIDIYSKHSNIYQLYEANIGPLTPMVADELREAEKIYHPNWIADAFRIATERKKRNWHYLEAILKRWQEGGRDDRKDQQARRDTEEARRRYSEWEK